MGYEILKNFTTLLRIIEYPDSKNFVYKKCGALLYKKGQAVCSSHILLWFECHTGDDHFFQRNTSMLICIFIILYIMVVIIWICKEVIFLGKDK